MIDARAEVLAVLHLVEVTTTEGPFRFMLGQDGIFTDVNGQEWAGSTILSGSDDEFMIGDIAPRGSLTMTWLQDPSMPDVVAELKAKGFAYIYGLSLRFFVQPIASAEEVYAPVAQPVHYLTRQQVGLSFAAEGPSQRSITLDYESVGQGRNHQRRMALNTTDHSRLIGRQNPSLQFMPQEYQNQEPLIG
ncbi:hypothetical protein QCN27_03925 [Cereibacter sp. SYSU M97828]|nr:hypothetical protein [Cereibacter flavus]